MSDFLDKLDDELNNMQPKEVKKDLNEKILMTTVSNKKDTIKKIDNSYKTNSYKKTSYSNNKKDSSTEKKVTNRYYNNDSRTNKFNHREKFVSTFPETRFYLPSLREKHTRYIPIG
jgi:hypothetical protein